MADRSIFVQQFELHVFELAYVLSLMGVESVATLPDAVLFPLDPKLRQKILREGEKRLTAQDLMTPDEQAGQANYNDALLSMAAAVADPRLTILTRRETDDGRRTHATLFFNQVEVVELIQAQRDRFRLRRLRDAAEAFQQVRKMIGVAPSTACVCPAAEVGITTFEGVRQHIKEKDAQAAAGDLVEAGMSAEAAGHFVAALAAPQRRGVVSILKHVAQKVVDVRVLGFYLRDGGTWLTSVASDAAQQVRIESVDAEAMVRRLVDRVGNLCTTTALSVGS